MYKILLVIASLTFLLYGCNQEELVTIEEEVIIIDDQSYHKMKLATNLTTSPFIIKHYEEMVDNEYGDVFIEMYDSRSQLVYSLKWRDLFLSSDNFSSKPLVYDKYLLINVQGVISVHNLIDGVFLWELETSKEGTEYIINDNILYVLYHGVNIVTGVDLENGKKILEIPLDEKSSEMKKISVDSEKITVFYQDSNEDVKNALEFSIEGTFIKKKHHKPEINKTKNNKWNSIETSSSIETAINIIDFSTKTSWAEGVKGYGEKEWLEIKRTMPTIVNKLIIYNGNHSSEKSYEENSKLKFVSLSIGDERTFKFVFNEFVYNEATIIEFVKPITADYMMLMIEEIEPGTLYKNTTISEIYSQ